MKYNQRIKDLRKDKNMTLEEIAKDLGLQREQYRRYETGINEIKVGFLIKLCKYHKVSADYMLGLTDIKKLCQMKKKKAK